MKTKKNNRGSAQPRFPPTYSYIFCCLFFVLSQLFCIVVIWHLCFVCFFLFFSKGRPTSVLSFYIAICILILMIPRWLVDARYQEHCECFCDTGVGREDLAHKKPLGEVTNLQHIWACLQSGVTCVALIMVCQQNPHTNSKGEPRVYAWGAESENNLVKSACYGAQAIGLLQIHPRSQRWRGRLCERQ